MGGQVLALVGTRKGAFVLRADRDRRRWELTGPLLAGMEINHLVYDRRDGSLYAAANSYQYGATVHRSTDLGQTWTHSSEGLRYGADDAERVRRVWHVEPGPASEPGVVYAGVEDSGLFRSDDCGRTWRELGALRRHPTHDKWEPGNGGKCLHTIQIDPYDPRRLYIAVSAGGIYRSDDGGESWQAINRGIRAPFLPEGQQYPEAGQCVHRFSLTAARPGRIYLQHHYGLYRSDDRGQTWQAIESDLPSTFGFGLVAHPRRADVAYAAILSGDDNGRWMPEGRMAIWRTTDAGASWQAMRRGLPQENAYVTVLREAMAHDGADPLGIYVGTTQGELFASADEGESWTCIAANLPSILGVSAAVVE